MKPTIGLSGRRDGEIDDTAIALGTTIAWWLAEIAASRAASGSHVHQISSTSGRNTRSWERAARWLATRPGTLSGLRAPYARTNARVRSLRTSAASMTVPQPARAATVA